MARELNKELFGDLIPEQDRNTQRGTGTANRPWPSNDPNERFVREEEFRFLTSQVEILRRKLKEQDSKNEALNTRVNELANASKVRIDRISSAMLRMEEFIKSTFQDTSQRFASLSSRFNERKINETKIQELLDRHTSVIQSFETRLAQMQKVITEQEFQLMNARAALQEAQRKLR